METDRRETRQRSDEGHIKHVFVTVNIRVSSTFFFLFPLFSSVAELYTSVSREIHISRDRVRGSLIGTACPLPISCLVKHFCRTFIHSYLFQTELVFLTLESLLVFCPRVQWQCSLSLKLTLKWTLEKAETAWVPSQSLTNLLGWVGPQITSHSLVIKDTGTDL